MSAKGWKSGSAAAKDGATRATRLLVAAVYMIGALAPFGLLVAPERARAQTSLVSVCSGVSLPRSVVTDIMGPVITGVVTPLEDILDGLLGILVPDVDVGADDLLNDAASGQNINLQVLDVNGGLVDPDDACINQADGFTLAEEAGIAIGGNQITGLGSGGAIAVAGEVNSIAFGNGAVTAATSADAIALGPDAEVLGGAAGSIAFGADASVAVANSLALGSSSTALRGAQTGYSPLGVVDPQNSVGEVSFGAVGAERQLTNVAAGSEDTDAVNLRQLRGVATGIEALAALAVTYDDSTAASLTLGGATGTRITNLSAGLLTSGSTDAVNGAQLFGLGSSLAAEIGGSTVFDPASSTLDIGLTYDGVIYGSVQEALDAVFTTSAGGSPFLAVNSALGGALAGGLNSTAVGPAASASADNSVALGASSTATRGSLAAYAALGLDTPQTSSGEVSIGAVGAERQLTNVAAGSAVTDAVNVGQLQGVSNDLQALADVAVAYNDSTRASLTLAGIGGTIISNVAAGDLSAASTEAVNGSQLFATNTQVTASVNAIDELGTDLETLAQTAVQYDDLLAGRVTLAGVDGTVIGNVAAGALTATSTEAVNGGQLFATNTQVGINTTAITSLSTDLGALSDTAVMYDDLLAGRVTLAGVDGTVIGNVAAGALTSTSSEAVNGAQLFATNTQVGVNTTAITNLSTDLGALSDTAVMYDDLLAGRVTLAGVDGTVIGNVAAGALTSTSTEAVNGAQLFATNTQVGLNTDAIADIAAVSALAVAYDDPSFDTLTLAGPAGTTISNVAAGELSAASAEAVNGAQLFATNTQVGENTADIVTNTTAITTITNNLNNGAVGVVQYSNAADPTTPNGGGPSNDVTLVGALAGPVGLHNVAAGLIASGSSDAVNGGQIFAFGQSAAAGFGGGTAFNPVTNTLDVAITYQGVEYASIQAFLNALSATPLGSGPSVYLAVNSNLAPATAQGQDAVAVGPESQAVADNSVALGAGSVADRAAQTDYAALGVTGLLSSAGSVSFGSAGAERQLTHVAAGTAATDAVNVAQLQGVSDRVEAIAGTAVSYDTTTRDTLSLAGANGTTITNVAAGQVNANSSDAVNGSQLFATNTQVAQNTTAITNLTNDIANGSLGPVQYSDGDDPETPNGGVRSDDLTLVGASGGAVGLHNVANGRIAAGSTDAVNGGQIYELAFAATNAVQYDTDANGGRTNSITFQGGDASSPVTLNNVAAGAVTATSTEAVNGSQLFQTNQAVATAQTTADSALALGQNSLQYADQGQTRVVLGRSNGPAVTVSNVAAGVADTDAVNVLQLRESMNEAIQQSNTYTDMRLAAVNYNVQEVRKLAFAGTAGALAAAGMPQIAERGKSMFAVGYGTYEGQSAMAMGYSRALGDGSMVFRAGATFDTQNHVGANAGIGWRF
ncbi:autotransporter adhesin [Brevundimonas vesicularis]|uniref:Autotransporter adhesin n=1 Tax=Brevundimonas vesicularis TaxID=41276 RepID=A0A7W9FWP8_BREVE|nr:YadA-like family protein [Brevundimonas vesicularis]MBB5772899.1 autotransporter adhesin [Brevundimonas vesicularis]